MFAAFALALLFTKRPWVDEAWFTGPALDLVTHGRFGTLLLDPAGSHLRLYKPDAFLQGIKQRTYWVMPLHLLQLAHGVSCSDLAFSPCECRASCGEGRR